MEVAAALHQPADERAVALRYALSGAREAATEVRRSSAAASARAERLHADAGAAYLRAEEIRTRVALRRSAGLPSNSGADG